LHLDTHVDLGVATARRLALVGEGAAVSVTSCRVEGAAVSGVSCRVEGVGLRVQGLGLRVGV
jgi:hypothetical protein